LAGGTPDQRIALVSDGNEQLSHSLWTGAMASYLEMQKLAQNPATAPLLASYLRRLDTVQWTDWELDFLESMAARTNPEPISTRQREVLVELRDDAVSHTTTRDGQNVRALILRCWQARLDLEEDDETFIDELYRSGTISLKRRPLGRLLGCARQLNWIDR
jgi:hypothetical protein